MGSPAHSGDGDITACSRTMIRVAVVDDHYAIRLGLNAALASQPDMEPVGAVSSAAELTPLLYRTAPDVVILDYRLPDEDGLSVCLRIKADAVAPALLLHSAFADDWLTVPAILAGADGVLHKGSTGTQLADAIRTIAAGRPYLPAVAPDVLAASGETLAPEDRPILGMLIHGTPRHEIARTLRLDPSDLRGRLARMLDALRNPAAK
jgi:DNA-binding NarL/FixJ family response regulator